MVKRLKLENKLILKKKIETERSNIRKEFNDGHEKDCTCQCYNYNKLDSA